MVLSSSSALVWILRLSSRETMTDQFFDKSNRLIVDQYGTRYKGQRMTDEPRLIDVNHKLRKGSFDPVTFWKELFIQ